MNIFLIFDTPQLTQCYDKELNRRSHSNYPIFKWITILMIAIETISLFSYRYMSSSSLTFQFGSSLFNAVVLYNVIMVCAYSNIAIVKFPSLEKYYKHWEFFVMLVVTTCGILYNNNAVSTLLASTSQNQSPTFILLAFDFTWKIIYMNSVFRSWYWRCAYFIGTLCFFVIKLSNLSNVLPAYVIYRGTLAIFFLTMLVYAAERMKKISFIESLKLEEQDKTFRGILELTPESILILDSRGKVKYANKFMKKMIGHYEVNEENDLVDHTEMFAKFVDFKIPRHLVDSMTESRLNHSKVFDPSYDPLPTRTLQNTLHNTFDLDSKLPSDPVLPSISLKQPSAQSPSHRHKSSIPPLKPPSISTSLALLKQLHSFSQLIHHMSEHFSHLKSNYTLDSKSKSFLTFYGKFQETPGSTLKSIELKLSIAKFDKEDCFIAIFRDTTERDLIALYENNSAYKDNLLASVSHELRTPLNGNLNFLECAISDTQIPAVVKDRYLIPALTSGKLLYHLINDILDLSQININQLELNISKMHLVNTVEYCKSLLKFQAEFKKDRIQVETLYDVDLPEHVNSDPNRLKQILLNLVNNALKYTYNGKITIRVKKEGDWVKFEVEDTGIGISSEEIVRLRKNLNLNSHSTMDKVNKHSTGIGLGLSISNALAKYLGPDEKSGIDVFSTEGKGSIFSFLIRNLMDDNLPSPAPQDEDTLPFGRRRLLNRASPGDQTMVNSKYYPMSTRGAGNIAGNEEDVLGNGKFIMAESSPAKYIREITFLKVENVEKEVTLEKGVPKYSYRESNCAGGESTEDLDEHAKYNDRGRADSMKGGVFPKATSFVKFDTMSTTINNISKKSFMAGNGESSVRGTGNCACPEVLIVDDDGFNIKAMEYLLIGLGKSFASVFNGKEAVDKVIERKIRKCGKSCKQFQLIVMDCNMPIMDGYEASRELKGKMKEGELVYIPIVACTSYVGRDMIEKCAASGMDEYLSKPVNKEELRAVVARYIGKVEGFGW